jgi:hypothetical protein
VGEFDCARKIREFLTQLFLQLLRGALLWRFWVAILQPARLLNL